MAKLPDRIIDYFNNVGSAFGGYQELQSICTTSELEYIFNFPGPVYIIKPWSLDINILDHNYLLNSPYWILDKNFSLLYEGSSSTGFIGDTLLEKELLLTAKHGSYLHLKVKSFAGDRLLLFWICNRLTKNQIRLQIENWENIIEQYSSRPSHEVVLDITTLNFHSIKITYLTGYFKKELRVVDILNNSNSQTVDYPIDLNYINLTPIQSGWYVFEGVGKHETVLLDIENLEGSSASRIKKINNGCYYFDLNARRQINTAINSYDIISTHSQLNASGSLSLSSQYHINLLSATKTNIISYSIKSLKALINGRSEIISRISPTVSISIESHTSIVAKYSISELLLLNSVCNINLFAFALNPIKGDILSYTEFNIRTPEYIRVATVSVCDTTIRCIARFITKADIQIVSNSIVELEDLNYDPLENSLTSEFITGEDWLEISISPNKLTTSLTRESTEIVQQVTSSSNCNTELTIKYVKYSVNSISITTNSELNVRSENLIRAYISSESLLSVNSTKVRVLQSSAVTDTSVIVRSNYISVESPSLLSDSIVLSSTYVLVYSEPLENIIHGFIHDSLERLEQTIANVELTAN